MYRKRFLWVYACIILGDIIGIVFQIDTLVWVFKPLLMVSLGEYAYSHIKNRPPQLSDRFLLAALGFSWLGDVLLMNPQWFVFGLLAFLIAHLCYIIVFKKDNPRFVWQQTDRLWAVGATLVFTGSLITYLFDYLGVMRLPVIVYAIVITVMLLTVLNRWKAAPSESFALSMWGAALFAFSDSIIAINKFAQPISGAGVIIMLTYAVGQFLIVEGYLRKE